MSDWTGKKARLVEKRARHVENIEATTNAIAAIDARIAECDEKIAANKEGEVVTISKDDVGEAPSE